MRADGRSLRTPTTTALILIGDKKFRGKDFETELAELDATILRPDAKTRQQRPHLAPIRQRIESIFWTCKDILTPEHHGARTLQNLRVRLCARRPRHAQPPTRPTQPRPGRLHRINPWRKSSEMDASVKGSIEI